MISENKHVGSLLWGRRGWVVFPENKMAIGICRTRKK
jgi:hypothetical protein